MRQKHRLGRLERRNYSTIREDGRERERERARERESERNKRGRLALATSKNNLIENFSQ